MKKDIHPKYDICEVTCACGNTFKTRSIKPAIKVEICAACHPFFTGKQRFTDTAGRVDKFMKKFAATDGKMVEREAKKAVVAKVTPRHTVRRKLSSAAATAAESVSKPAAKKEVKTAAKPEAK